MNIYVYTAITSAILAAAPASAQLAWSDPAAWPSGRVPAEGEAVTVPAGTEIVLDVSPPALRSLRIDGSLRFDERELRLRAGWIYVTGELQIGTEAVPHRSPATITLDGPDEEALGMGGRFLATGEGGSLQLHGVSAAKRAWTQLDGHLEPGATTLRLAERTDWAVGDEIVVAPSGWDPAEAERVRITSIDGREVAFAPALRYAHFGELQTYADQVVDERAEVGLLTRNILIEGPETAEEERFGAHSMIMAGSGPVAVEGASFRRMGQPGRAARYTFHWHLCGVRDGDYFRDNSIYDALQRGVVVHGTDSVLVERNVAYHVANHAYVPAEDGNEVGNKFYDNLAVHVRRVADGEIAFPRHNAGGSNQAEHRVAGFWLRNMHNELVGNHVAGAERGVGFFYDRFGKTHEHSLFDRVARGVVFRGNVAHTISVPGNRLDEGVANVAMYATVGHGHGLFFDDFDVRDAGVRYRFEDFTAYKCDMSGIWGEFEEALFTGLTLADNATALQTGEAFVDDALVVGQTANTIGGESRDLRHGQQRAGFYTIAQGGGKRPRMRDVTFVDIGLGTRSDRPSAGLIVDYHLGYEPNYVADVEFAGSRPLYMDGGFGLGKTPEGTMVWDVDGSLTGRDGGRLVTFDNSPLARPDDCEWIGDWNAFLCPTDLYLDLVLTWADEGRHSLLLDGPTGLRIYDGGFAPRVSRVRRGEAYVATVDGWHGDQTPQQDFTLELKPFADSDGGFAYFTFPFPFAGALLTDQDGVELPRYDDETVVRQADHPSYSFDAGAGEVFVKAYAPAPAAGARTVHFAVGDQLISSLLETRLAGAVTGARVWPNPLAPSTDVHFGLREPGPVSVTLADALGRPVRDLFSGSLDAGEHALPIAPSDLPAGVYFVTVNADGAEAVTPLTVAAP